MADRTKKAPVCLVVTILATLTLLGLCGRFAAADDPRPAPLLAIAADAVEAAAVQPSIELEVVEEQPHAGMRVHVKAVTRGLGAKKKLRWVWPADEIDGVKFGDPSVVQASELGRMVEIVWPRGGEYEIACKATVVTVLERDAAGIPTDFDAEEIKGTVTLSLAGGVGPSPGRDPLPAPSAELQAAVKPITTLLAADHATADAAQLADIYRDLADVIGRDHSVVKRTGDVAEANRRAGTLLAQPSRLGPIGLGKQLDALALATLGKDDVDLTADVRGKAVALFRAIGWACQEGAK